MFYHRIYSRQFFCSCKTCTAQRLKDTGNVYKQSSEVSNSTQDLIGCSLTALRSFRRNCVQSYVDDSACNVQVWRRQTWKLTDQKTENKNSELVLFIVTRKFLYSLVSLTVSFVFYSKFVFLLVSLSAVNV